MLSEDDHILASRKNTKLLHITLINLTVKGKSQFIGILPPFLFLCK